jgi:hypothetical protein
VIGYACSYQRTNILGPTGIRPRNNDTWLQRILLILEPAGVLANHNPKTALVHLDSDQLALARLLAFVVVEVTRGRTLYHGVDAKHHEPCPSST